MCIINCSHQRVREGDLALWAWDVRAVGTNFFAQTEHCLPLSVQAAFFPVRWVNRMGDFPQYLIDEFHSGLTFCAIGQRKGACTTAK